MSQNVAKITQRVPAASVPVAETASDASGKDEPIWKDGVAVIKLSRPITVHGETGPVAQSELVLTEPTFGTQRRLGTPVRQIRNIPEKGEPETVEFLMDYEILGRYLEAMTPASINGALLDGMALSDVRKCEQAISAIFVGEVGN